MPRSITIDASALIKPFLGEEGADEVSNILSQARTTFAPDILYYEIGNILWKRYRRGLISDTGWRHALLHLESMPITLHSPTQFIKHALALSVRLKIPLTPYDASYVVTAQRTDSVLITADKKLVEAVQGTLYEKHVQLLTSA